MYKFNIWHFYIQEMQATRWRIIDFITFKLEKPFQSSLPCDGNYCKYSSLDDSYKITSIYDIIKLSYPVLAVALVPVINLPGTHYCPTFCPDSQIWRVKTVVCVGVSGRGQQHEVKGYKRRHQFTTMVMDRNRWLCLPHNSRNRCVRWWWGHSSLKEGGVMSL